MKHLLLPVFFLMSLNLIAQFELKTETCLTSNEHQDRYASYSPDGNHILFESDRDGNWNIYLMDANGNKQLRLTEHESDDRRPAWHPSGNLIIFESERNGNNELYTLDLRNYKVAGLENQSNDTSELLFAVYSPDGKNIAASLKDSDDVSNIVLMDSTGKIIRRLTNTEWRSHYPRWSPDGSEIVYFSRKETNNNDDEIYRINVSNGTEVRLTNWPKHNFCPDWSYDGSKIAYVTSMDTIRPELYIMDKEGSNQTRITFNEDGDTLPNWHPSKNKLLITGYREGNFEICVLELEFN